ncbi:NosD domain-containing protein [Peribacillus frigoritolerans]|uniref:NosD domain-containing protein n=1 Tax=Peribacillus frigoritolerans TaxID=450367 RepID=UPI003872902A
MRSEKMTDVNVNFPPTVSPNRSVTAGDVETMVTQVKADVEGQVSVVSAQLAETANDIKERGISVKKFGVKGDGVTDDTVKIQTAIDYCATNKLILIFPFGVYNVSTLLPKQGILGFQSYGAVVKAISKSGEGVFASNLSTTVSDYFVDGFSIDCNGLGRRGVFCYGNRISVTNNNIYGLNSSVNSEQAIRFHFDSSDNMVDNNTITLSVDQPFGTFVSLIGIHFAGKANSIYAGLDTTNDIIQGTNRCLRNKITNNTINGGTHGVSLMTADYNLVEGNIISKQSHRCIILSPNATHNTVKGNNLSEFGSAGIHMAYGSIHNLVTGNNLYSTGEINIGSGGGESAIQSYVHCKNNVITGNKIYTRSTKYGIYSAIHGNGTVISNNVVDGGSRACICCESDWSGSLTVDEKYGRPNFELPPNVGWTSWDNGKGFNYLTIKNNIIERLAITDANAGIYIGQSQNANFSNIIIDGNAMNSESNAAPDFYVYVYDKDKFINNHIINNTVTPLTIEHVVFTNKDLNLLSYRENNWQKRFSTISVATSIIDTSVSDNIAINTAMTITDFSNSLSDSQHSPRIITVRLSAGVVITHDNAKIRLKGSVNISATSSNQIISFMMISGIAFELYRNF